MLYYFLKSIQKAKNKVNKMKNRSNNNHKKKKKKKNEIK